MRTALALTLAALIAGCATQILPTTTLHASPAGFDPASSSPPAAEDIFHARQKDAFEAAVAVLQDEGFEMASVNMEAGFIGTHWRARGSGASKMDLELVEREDGIHISARCWMYNSSDVIKTPNFVYKMIYSKVFKSIRKKLSSGIKLKEPTSP